MRRLSMLLAMVMLVSSFSFTTVFADGARLFQATFDADGTGTSDGFAFNNNNGIIMRREIYDKDGKSLVIMTSPNGLNQNPNTNMEWETPIASNMFIEYLFMTDSIGLERTLLMLRDSNNISVNLLKLNVDGEICFIDNTGDNPIMEYTPGEWVRIQVGLNLKRKVVDIYINGKKRISGASFKSASAFQNLKLLRFEQIDPQGVGGTLIIDDLNIYEGTTAVVEEPMPDNPSNAELIKPLEDVIVRGAEDVERNPIELEPDDGGFRIYLNEDFNADNKSDVPNGFTYYPNNGLITRGEFLEEGNKVVMLSTTEGVRDQYPSFHKGFSYLMSGSIVMEVSLYAEDYNVNRNIFELKSGSNQGGMCVKMTTDGNFATFDNKVLQPFRTNTWYKVSVIFNTDTKLMDFYIDGKLLLAQYPIQNSLVFNSISTIRINCSDTNGVGSKLYIDDMRVYRNDTLLSPEELEALTPEETEVLPHLIMFTEKMQDKMGNAVGIFIDRPRMYQNKILRDIVSGNPDITPVKVDETVYVPVSFLKEVYGIDHPATAREIDGVSYAALSEEVEKIGKVVYEDYRGLVVIGDTQVFDPVEDKMLVNELIGNLIYERPSGTQVIDDIKAKHPNNQHPRVLVTQDRFDELKGLVQTDETMASWLEALKKEAEQMMDSPPEPYRQVYGDGNLVNYVRIVKRRVEVLCLLYKITGEEAYKDRAWVELENAAVDWTDWNPVHFLDAAEMMYTVSIGYDWLYYDWTEQEREILRNAIVEKGLKPGLEAYSDPMIGVWADHHLNWNAVCNGSLVVAAAAVAETDERLCSLILETGIRGLEYMLVSYQPDGAWDEGPTYWQFATSYLTQCFSTLDAAVGTTYGLFETPQLGRTPYYPLYVAGTQGHFNYHDSDVNETVNPPLMFWFANKLGDPSLTNLRATMLRNGNRVSPYDLLWYDPNNNTDDVSIPKDNYFRVAETGSLRSEWDDADAIFVGFHGGPVHAGHGNLDVGTFIIDAIGERWAMDLGKEDYNIDGYSPQTEYTFYKKKTEGHNCLVFNPDASYEQDVNATAEIVEFDTNPQGGYAIMDLTDAYKFKGVNSTKRGYMLFDNRSRVKIQDEFTADLPTEVYWFMHTTADIEVQPDGRSAILTINDKQLWAGISGDSRATFSVMDAVPLPTSPNPPSQDKNVGIRKLAIHMEGVTSSNFAVEFKPLEAGEALPTVTSYVPLESWSIPEGEVTVPTLSAIAINGEDVGEFAPLRKGYIYNLVSDDKAMPQVTTTSDDVVNIEYPSALPGDIKITVSDKDNPASINVYRIHVNIPIKQGVPEGQQAIAIQSVQASDVPQPENSPENTLDGDYGTRWSAMGEAWIQYDLGSVYKVTDVALAWHEGAARKEDFEIMVSTDGENWEIAFDGESSGETAELETYGFSAKDARYVRINGHGTSVSAWNSLTEIAVYGAK